MSITGQKDVGELLCDEGVMQNREVVLKAAMTAASCPSVEVAELQ